jgi:hypothetical protein
MKMRVPSKYKAKKSAKSRLFTASTAILEPMEKRMMMSATQIAVWDFNSTALTSNPAIGAATATSDVKGVDQIYATGGFNGAGSSSDTALTIGMQNTSNIAVNAGNGFQQSTYTFYTAGASTATDTSDLLSATTVAGGGITADSGADGGSVDGNDQTGYAFNNSGYVWRIETGQAETAAIATQGLQVDAPTTGFNSIEFSFDMNPSSTKAEAQFAVEYTTDVQDGSSAVWNNVTQDLTFGAGDLPDPNNNNHVATIGTSSSNDIELQTNSGNPNIIAGTYATITGPLVGSNTAWLNDLVVDLSGVSSAANSPGFAFRVVNAATGSSETAVSGSATATFKNWRFNNMQVVGVPTAPSGPSVLTQPQNVTVNAGSSATFTSTATGYPIPSEQWQVSLDGGQTFQNVNSTLVPGAGNGYNTSTFTITGATVAQTGDIFRAVYNNGLGGDAGNNVDSSTATLTVQQLFSPTITANPGNITTNGTNTVSFTAAATGNPTPAVQWQFEPTGGSAYSNVSTGTYNQATYTFVASPSTAGSYRAVFTNSQGSTNSASATLTVYATPTVITSPTSQTISVPGSVTFTAKALAEVVPTVTWQYEPSGSSTFINVSSGTASVAGGVATYNTTTGAASFTFTPVLADNGDQFRILVADNQGASVPSSAATLTVHGEVIADWTFANSGGLTAPAANSPAPDYGNGTLTSLGMQNDYNPGVESVGPEDDIVSTQGSTDTNYTENTWRDRGGASPTTAGSPEGWSSFAPEFTQGAEMQVPTTGYNDVELHFDWYSTTKGPRNAVIMYTTDGQTWQTYNFSNGSPFLANPGDDYYGSTNSSTAPTGVTADFSNIPAVNNNPNFAVEFVSAYQPTDYTAADMANPASNSDAALPPIYDGNLLVTDGNGSPIAHGQYATASTNNATSAYGSQEIQIGGQNDTGTFTLTVPTASGNETTQPISYVNQYTEGTGGTFTSVLATNIQAALSALSNVSGVSVTFNDGMSSNFIIALNGATGPMTASSSLSGTYFPAEDNAAYHESGEPSVNVIYAGNITPYSIAGYGNWRLGQIDFTGNSGAPNIFQEPQSQTVELTTASPTRTVTFTSSVFSATPDVTVQWEVNTNDGTGFNPVTNGSGGTTLMAISGSPNDYSSTYTFTASTVSQTQYEFEAVFTNTDNSTSSTSAPATLLVVQPTAPSVQSQPISTTTVAGTTANFTATFTGLPLDATNATTTWQQNNGSGWTNASSGVVNTYTTLSTGYISETSTLSLTTTLSENGYTYRCVITNASGTGTSNPATLSVVPVEQDVTDWNFGNSSPTGVVAPGVDVSPTAPYAGGPNTPTPNVDIAPGSLTTIGMIDSNFTPPSVPAADIILTLGTADQTYATNTWRVRGGPTPSTPGANGVDGWDQAAPQYTQGAEIDVNATNMENLYLSFQWFATSNSIRDLQVQYCLDTTAGTQTWTNLGSALIANPNDFYGANGTAAPTGVVANLTNISGANNDAHLGIRLVSAYDPALSNQYALATLVNGAVQPYVNGSGNWRFGQIQVNAIAIVPTWLSPSSSSVNGGPAVWNYANQTLTVASGTATIIGDPALSGDSPNLIISGSNTTLDINYAGGNTVNIGSLSVSGGATVALTASGSNILIVPAGATFSITSGSKLDLGKGFLDLKASTATQATGLLASVNGLVATGYNNGLWTGVGIDSSTAATDPAHLKAVGVIENNGIYGTASGSLGLFDNVAPGIYDVLVRQTYYGDANLDGKVDGSDYSLIDNAYTHPGMTGWANGNFNYDNAVDGSDYTLIDNAFNTQGGDPLALIASPTAQIATATSPTTGRSFSVFAKGLPLGSFAGTASAATSTIDDLLKHDKKHILAGSLLEGVSR